MQGKVHNRASAPRHCVSPILVFYPEILRDTHDSLRARSSQSAAGSKAQRVLQSVRGKLENAHASVKLQNREEALIRNKGTV